MATWKIKSSRAAAIAGAAVLALSVAACGGSGGSNASSASSGGSASAAGGKTPATIEAGIIPSPDSAVLYLGQDKGFFSKYGITLKFNAAAGGAAIVPPVVSGQWQLGFSNVVSIMQATENAQPLVMIAPSGSTWGEKGKGINKLYVMPNSGIKSAKQLEGKTVAVNTLGNLLQTEADISVDKAGGDPKKVQYTAIAPPQGVGALVGGQVDAAMCNEPFCMQMEQKGAVLLDDSSYTLEPGKAVATAAWFTTQTQIDKNKQLFKNLQAAINESNAYATAHPDETRAEMVKVVTTLDPTEAQNMLLNNWPAKFSDVDLKPLAKAAVKYGLMNKEPDYSKLVWDGK